MSDFNFSPQQNNKYSTWNNNNQPSYRGRGHFQGRGRGRGRGGQGYKPNFNCQVKDYNIVEIDYSPTSLERKYSKYYSTRISEDPWKDLSL
ncbi:unnamed protein product [Cunninghamella blakesleeana]